MIFFYFLVFLILFFVIYLAAKAIERVLDAKNTRKSSNKKNRNGN